MLANPRFSAAIRAPAIAGLLLILPFAIMEFMFNILNNPRALNANGLIGLTVLFGLLWLLPTAIHGHSVADGANCTRGNRYFCEIRSFSCSESLLC